jgi:ribosomal protein S27AE
MTASATIVRALLAEVERLQTERRECPRCLYEFRLDGVPVDQ